MYMMYLLPALDPPKNPIIQAKAWIIYIPTYKFEGVFCLRERCIPHQCDVSNICEGVEEDLK